MRCLSVKQPWAGLIGAGLKTLEVRSWYTDYRGPLVICSSQSPERMTGFYTDNAPKGVAICLVELVAVRPTKPEDEGRACAWGRDLDGLFAFMLENARGLPPVPVTGRLGFFEPPPALARVLRTMQVAA
jgi:hypothetical protein